MSTPDQPPQRTFDEDGITYTYIEVVSLLDDAAVVHFPITTDIDTGELYDAARVVMKAATGEITFADMYEQLTIPMRYGGLVLFQIMCKKSMNCPKIGDVARKHMTWVANVLLVYSVIETILASLYNDKLFSVDIIKSAINTPHGVNNEEHMPVMRMDALLSVVQDYIPKHLTTDKQIGITAVLRTQLEDYRAALLQSQKCTTSEHVHSDDAR